ncbi:MAG TPA: L-threonylcarbamoyladenylate synthase [Terracidiphilus sp.]|nr:L-threonylcarbamoyladenylate synthase [Terracidiphilus sp.]
MTTLRLSVDPRRLDAPESRHSIDRAAEILCAGGLVAMPTETVYGLAASALDADAVARIFAAKQRPSWDPVIVHIAGPVEDNPMLAQLVNELPERARKLMTAFWPGPLTLLLPRSKAVPDAVTAGRPLVGIRMPAHPVAFELIRRCGLPLAAPSANVFSHVSPTTAAHVLDDLDGRIDAVLDAGPADHGLESTVLDPSPSPMIIYRPGAVTAEQIEHVAGHVELFKSDRAQMPTPPESLPSPGIGMRHYAPRAKLVLLEGSLKDLAGKIAAASQQHAGEKIGVMIPEEIRSDLPPIPNAVPFPWGSWASLEQLAHNVFAGLRFLDAQGCTVILCPLPPDAGLGSAIRDRLRKAARS